MVSMTIRVALPKHVMLRGRWPPNDEIMILLGHVLRRVLRTRMKYLLVALLGKWAVGWARVQMVPD